MTTTAVDRSTIDRSHLRAVVAIGVLNALDIATTYAAFRYGAVEGNPLAGFMIQSRLLIPAKVLLVASLALGLRYRRTRPATLPSAAWMVVGVYGLVFVMNTLNVCSRTIW